MLQLLADEQISWALIEGLVSRQPDLNILRVLDVGLGETDDREILAWAAENGRVIITEDHATMPRFAYDRVLHGLPMAGVILIDDRIPIARRIEDILITAVCSTEEEFSDRIERVPLRPPAR